MPSSRYIFGTLPFYSVLIVSGMILAIFLASREEKRLGLPKDTVLDLALFLIPISVICARAYYVIFSWDAFRSEPLSVFAVWEGGLAIYGGLIGGLVTVLVFAYIRRISPLTLFDMIVPGVALAQALGRWGNFFNMEAYGLPVENPALQFFPFAVQIPDNGFITWHMATFFYESLWDFCVFLVLFLLRKRSGKPGILFLLYSLAYAAGRLVIEELRMDSLMAGSLRVSQMLGFTVCLGVLIWLICLSRPVRAQLPFVLLLLLQPVLFFVLPRPGTEHAVAPYFFLALMLLVPCLLLSSLHKAPARLFSVALCAGAWTAYALLAGKSSFLFNLTYSVSALFLGAVLFYPHFSTEVSHADHTAA